MSESKSVITEVAAARTTEAENLKACEELLKEPDLVQRFLSDIAQIGLVGERTNAATVFLVAISAKLPHPLSLTVQGASSSGKNYLPGKVAHFIPDEMKKSLTGMTPKALMHADEHEYEHKAIFITEYEGVSCADYAIRTFQSEQMIEWEFVETTKQGIKHRTQKVRGPASFIQATTRSLLHPENETRLLFAQMDESDELTTEIMKYQASEAESGSTNSATDVCDPWHALINTLDNTRVVVTYARGLVGYLP